MKSDPKNLKTVIINFNHFSPLKTSNTAVVTVIPGQYGAPPLLSNISFEKPIRKISREDLTDLFNQVESIALNEAEIMQQAGLVTVGDMGSLMVNKSGKGVIDFKNKLELMTEKIKGSMTNEEKEMTKNAFSLVNKLLGIKK